MTARKQEVADFTDGTGFDVACSAAPFIPPPALTSGLPRVVAALRPGRVADRGSRQIRRHAVKDALTRINTLAHGGTSLDETATCHLLRNARLPRCAPYPPCQTTRHHHRPEVGVMKTATNTASPSPWSVYSGLTRQAYELLCRERHNSSYADALVMPRRC